MHRSPEVWAGVFGRLCWAEGLKIVRSQMFVILLFVFGFVPLICGFFMYILKDPAAARQAGLLGAKANLMGLGQADWPSLLNLLNLSVSQAGIVGFSFITSWVFGREFSDRTLKDLLVLPLSRASIVWAKFSLVGLWSLLLGALLNLPGWSLPLAFSALGRLLLVTLLVICLSTPVAFVASYGRGYLPPLGFIVMALVLGQVIATLGYGAYYPWTFPALFSGALKDQALNGLSYLLLISTVMAGLLATLGWWRWADQTH